MYRVNDSVISAPAYDNYYQVIGIYKKLIADVGSVITILLHVFWPIWRNDEHKGN